MSAGERPVDGADHRAPNDADRPLADADYRALAGFRAALRQFLAFSEQAARDAGITPNHHQLLLAIRGHAGAGPPSTSDLAESLQLRLHSAGELVVRAVEHGLIERTADPHDARRVLLALTPAGEAKLAALTSEHRVELRRFRREMAALLDVIEDERVGGEEAAR
ncbi:MAG: MarR family transcriptional regulator [Ilumatobacteraceae bacterium]|nr:MarR family transcriptional regulator [Ilumatobacteraceae bacterium]